MATDTELMPPLEDTQQEDAALNEKVVLGLLIQEATNKPELLSEVMHIISLDDLIARKNRQILGAMMELDMAGEPYGLVDVFQKLGGPTGPVSPRYLSELEQFAYQHASPFEITRYAHMVREGSERRRLENAAKEIIKLAKSGEYGTNRELFNRAEELLSGVEPTATVKTGPVPITALLPDYLEVLNDRYQQFINGSVPKMGLLTKLHDLDMLWTGLKPRKYYVIAARPAMGKTAFLVQVLLTIAEEENTYCLMFSAEMAKDEEMINRLVANRGRIDQGKLQTGALDNDDWERINGSLMAMPHRFLIDDTPNMSIAYVKRTARKLRREIGPDAKLVLAVDYMQLLKGPRHLGDDEYKLTSYISKELNSLKKELDATVIALSQLNRDLEKRQDKRPKQGDLRGSGQIEQDADLIAFLYRDEVYNTKSDDKNVCEVITEKQRAGKTGTVKLVFLKEFGRFESFQRLA